jgi:hypothetical protein
MKKIYSFTINLEINSYNLDNIVKEMNFLKNRINFKLIEKKNIFFLYHII